MCSADGWDRRPLPVGPPSDVASVGCIVVAVCMYAADSNITAGCCWRLSLSFSLISACSGLFAAGREIGETGSHGHVRTSVNGTVPSWKAGWVHALTSSNLVSSATAIPALTRAGIAVPGLRGGSGDARTWTALPLLMTSIIACFVQVSHAGCSQEAPPAAEVSDDSHLDQSHR
jgi:hypothetical protein